MSSYSLILDFFNKIISFSQDKFTYLWENSLILKHIDNLIYASIIGVFVISTFAASDYMGYLALIALFLTVIKLFVKPGEKIELNLFEFFLILYFLIIVISLAGSSLFHLSLKGFFKTFTYIGFYFAVVQYFKNHLSKIPLTIFVIALCAGSQGIIGLFQNFSQVGEISTWQDTTNLNPEDILTRVYGSIHPYNPNLYGGYLVASLPALFGSFVINLIDKHYKRSIVLFALTLLTSFSLILSGCRGAYVGLLVIYLSFFGFLAKYIWYDLQNKKEFFKKLYLSFCTFMAALAGCMILFIPAIQKRVLSIFAMRADSSTAFRMNVYQSAIQMIKDNWLVGIGVGNQNFREIYGFYMRTGFDALSAYSIYLEIAVESGIFALIAFLAFLITLIQRAIKFVLTSKDLKMTLIVATAIISVIATMVHGFVDTIFFRPQVQFIFWTMVAFISAILKSSDKFGEHVKINVKK